MFLEARSRNCFSNRYVLKLEGRPIGDFCGRIFSEGIDVRLTGRRRLHLEKTSLMGGRFRLTDAGGSVLAEAERAGLFTSAWSLTLSNGLARLVSSGLFNTGFHVEQDGRRKAETDRIDMCSGGWWVRGEGTLSDTDLLFIGLIYATILKHRAAAAASST